MNIPQPGSRISYNAAISACDKGQRAVHLMKVAHRLGSAVKATNHRQTIGKPYENCVLIGFYGIYPLVNKHNHGKSPFVIGKLTINGHVQ